MGCGPSEATLKKSKELDQFIRTNLNWKQAKVLLLGAGESGKSTVFKQMKIIQDNGGYSIEELLTYKPSIFSNCISQMRVMLEAAAYLQIQLHSEEALQHAQNLLALPSGANIWNHEIGSAIKVLWEDPGIIETFNLGTKKFQLNETAQYFFDNVERFMDDNYVPTVVDVLRVRVRSTGIEEASFVFDGYVFKVVDVGGQRSERRKWIHCFDNVDAIIFCASLNEYDQVLREDNTQNRMMESILLFDEVSNSNCFRENDIILFLNKVDLFDEKIKKVDLNICFKNYTGGSDPENAKDFIKQRFLERTNSKVFTHYTTAINTENIEYVITDVRKSLLKDVLGKNGIPL